MSTVEGVQCRGVLKQKIIPHGTEQPHVTEHPPRYLTLFQGVGGADSTRLQIVFFITSVRDAAEPRNLVTFLKFNGE